MWNDEIDEMIREDEREFDCDEFDSSDDFSDIYDEEYSEYQHNIIEGNRSLFR